MVCYALALTVHYFQEAQLPMETATNSTIRKAQVIGQMETVQNQPIHWDKHRIPVNITLIFSLVVAVYGLTLLLQGDNPLLLVAGIGVGAYSWFTNPRQYVIYPDALSVVYGRPRTKLIPFYTISRLEMRELQTPDRLRVWLTNGKRVVVLAKDVDTFHERLEVALTEFERIHPEYTIAEAPTGDSPIAPPGEPAGESLTESLVEDQETPPSETRENRPPDFT